MFHDPCISKANVSLGLAIRVDASDPILVLGTISYPFRGTLSDGLKHEVKLKVG